MKSTKYRQPNYFVRRTIFFSECSSSISFWLSWWSPLWPSLCNQDFNSGTSSSRVIKNVMKLEFSSLLAPSIRRPCLASAFNVLNIFINAVRLSVIFNESTVNIDCTNTLIFSTFLNASAQSMWKELVACVLIRSAPYFQFEKPSSIHACFDLMGRESNLLIHFRSQASVQMVPIPLSFLLSWSHGFFQHSKIEGTEEFFTSSSKKKSVQMTRISYIIVHIVFIFHIKIYIFNRISVHMALMIPGSSQNDPRTIPGSFHNHLRIILMSACRIVRAYLFDVFGMILGWAWDHRSGYFIQMARILNVSGN